MTPAVLTLRPLLPQERPAIARHLARLSPGQARLRFGHAPSESVLSRYVETLDFERDGVFGAVDEARGEVLAFAQMARDPEPGCGELGVSVESSCQGLSLGRALLARALVVAERFGLGTLLIHCTHDNAPMLALGRKAKGVLVREMGEMRFAVPVDRGLAALGRPEAMWGEWTAHDTSLDAAAPFTAAALARPAPRSGAAL